MLYGFAGNRLAEGYGWCGMGGGGFFPWIQMGFGLILLAAVIVLGIVLFRKFSKPVKDPAMDTLSMRYAQGEIDEEEYVQKKKMLQ